MDGISYVLLKNIFIEKVILADKKGGMGIREICIPTVRIYIKYWFQTASAIYSLRNDLQLLKYLKNYERINVIIS